MEALTLIRQQTEASRRIFNGVMQDVSQDMANWQPPGVANSIVDLYLHTVLVQDRMVGSVQGKPALFDQQWAETLKIPVEFRHTPEEARALRTDVATLKQYGDAVFASVDTLVSSLKDSDLDRMVEGFRGPQTLVSRLSGLLVTHICEHAGEISAIKGLQGAKGYA